MRLDEEREIINLCKADPEAFSQLYELNYGPLLNYATRRTGNVDVAKDIVAETFCKAIKNLDNYQWKSIPFSAWLYRIANNEVNQFFRDSKYKAVSLEKMIEQNGIEPRSEFDLEEILLAQEELEIKHKQFMFYRQKISELPIKYQEVLSLRFFESKSIKEISVILAKSEGTVKSLLHRGIEKLKKKEIFFKNAT